MPEKHLVDDAKQDLVFALRTFRQSPTFTAVAVLTLAIGIGANTAIFSAVNAMLLRPLPFAEPARLMSVSLVVPPRGDDPLRDDMVWSYPKATVFRNAQTIFEPPSLYLNLQFTVRTADGAAREEGELTDANYLRTLGVQPSLGRNFAEDEAARPGGARVAMISDAYWKRRYNADSSVVGGTLVVGGDPYTIVGVMPPGFHGLSGHAEFWLPVVSQADVGLDEPWGHSLSMVARLKPGVTAAQAKAAMTQLGQVVDEAWPAPEMPDEHWGASTRELDATRVDPVVRRSLLVLLGAVGLVLLIACANVANLFLVRAAGRRREIAVRLAIGASRGRLVRQLLTESVLLSVMGGVASVVLAWWGVKLLAALDPSTTLRAQQIGGLGAVGFDSIHLDSAAFAFAALLALATGVIFGLVPALQATHPSLTDALKDESARGGSRHGMRSRNVLAVAEIALALVLLAGSGLMLRSLGKLLGVNPGFRAEHVLTLRLNTGEAFGRDSLPGFYDAMLVRLEALPGVTSVALGDCPPLNGGCNGTVIAQHDRPAPQAGSEPQVGVHWVTPDWFAALSVPLQRGRVFDSGDNLDGRKVVVVSDAAARAYWPGEDPIGRPVSVGQGGFWNDTAYVVGVVGDVLYGTIDSLPQPDVYLSYMQSPRGRMMLYLRTSSDPRTLAGAVRSALGEIVPGAPVYDIRPLASRVADATAYARFSALLLTMFAGVALALAAIGIYGVVSFAVAQRTREIGVRVALGATRGQVVRLVVRQGIVIAGAGVLAGLAAALIATRVLRSLLYGIVPSDLATFAAIVVVLVATTVAATCIPARRAGRLDAMVALGER
jgi:predicted permease